MAVGNRNGNLKLVSTLGSAPWIQWGWGYQELVPSDFTVHCSKRNKRCLWFAGGKGKAPVAWVLVAVLERRRPRAGWERGLVLSQPLLGQGEGRGSRRGHPTLLLLRLYLSVGEERSRLSPKLSIRAPRPRPRPPLKATSIYVFSSLHFAESLL